MIIKHIIELETVINENSDEPSVLAIKEMEEQQRQQFFTEAATSFIAGILKDANEGHSWAEIRVVDKETV
ncbi:MAG: hypothetical protein EBR82_33195 [Caulobacteraceae bacterium]|nr:hypothetical protein [Caulobacteraceae bacterium]